MVFTHNIYPFCQALGRLANGFIMHKIAAESRISNIHSNSSSSNSNSGEIATQKAN